MTRYVGVDYSTRKVALASYDVDESDPEDATEIMSLWSWQAPRKVTGRAATQQMFEALEDHASATRCFLDASVVVEAPISGGNGSRSTALGMAAAFGGIWFCSLWHGALELQFAAPSHWKKLVTGFGGHDKSGVRGFLEANHPAIAAICDSDDEADAVCMALMARMVA